VAAREIAIPGDYIVKCSERLDFGNVLRWNFIGATAFATGSDVDLSGNFHIETCSQVDKKLKFSVYDRNNSMIPLASGECILSSILVTGNNAIVLKTPEGEKVGLLLLYRSGTEVPTVAVTSAMDLNSHSQSSVEAHAEFHKISDRELSPQEIKQIEKAEKAAVSSESAEDKPAEEAAASAEETPAAAESPAEAAAEEAPAEEAAPATEEAAPTTEEGAPATEEAAPATEEGAPATEEAAPATEEAAPATEEAALAEAAPANEVASAAE
jgi:hypothetical protein